MDSTRYLGALAVAIALLGGATHAEAQCVPTNGGLEICDGLDNDCNGKTDSQDGNNMLKNDRPFCEKQDGVCFGTKKALSLCVRGAWIPCSDSFYKVLRPSYANPEPATSCDNLDNDCDQATDETFVPAPTSCGTGACVATGERTCVAGVPSDSCVPGLPLAPDDTTADHVDDDCDGQTDEDVLCWPIGPDDPTCDGIDDDCDDVTDEDYVPTPVSGLSCGVGACHSTEGELQCIYGAETEVCIPGEPGLEVCNGVDDNCNGKTDSQDGNLMLVNDRPFCEKQDGVCAGTRKTLALCVSGGWRPCPDSLYLTLRPTYANPEPATSCDNADNDCDAATDEAYAPTPTTCGVGACQAAGAMQCVGGVPVDDCVPGAPLAADDLTCDAFDDDCDGVNDEDYVGAPTTCGIGLCQAAGELICVDGAEVDDCTPAEPPVADDTTCDGVDDDCSGEADEDFVPYELETTCGTGGCERHTIRSCAGGGYVDDCTPGAPGLEVCNGIDDDCNGLTDAQDGNGMLMNDRPFCEKQEGVCAGTRKALALCQGGAWIPCSDSFYKALKPAYTNPEPNECDGLDDDCDGGTDEAWIPTPTTCGVGACEAVGELACVAGVPTDTCVPDAPLAADDVTCDDVDDDCDAMADEDYAPTPTACGVGACEAAGELACVAGVPTDTCTPGIPAPDDPTCDGLDDDCNGLTDDTCCRPEFANLPESGFLNNSLCTVPGDDCASILFAPAVTSVGSCGDLVAFELYVEGVLADTVLAVGGAATFAELLFPDGSGYSLFSRAMAAIDPLGTSDSAALSADLTDPVVAFTTIDVGGFATPAAGSSQAYTQADDQDPATPGLQIPLHVEITDANLDGGFLDRVESDDGTGPVDVTVQAPALPLVLGSSPVAQTLTGATLPAVSGDQTITAFALDVAGNEASTSFTTGGDAAAPDPVAVSLDPTIDRRLPRVLLTWTAPGDDGSTGLATAYDIRFSRSPITDDASFNAACPVEDISTADPLIVPSAPGSAEQLELLGPDVRPAPSTADPDLCKFGVGGGDVVYYFAVRAIDEVGNQSPISAVEVASTDEINVRTAQLTFGGTIAEARMDRLFTPLGDINGDGMADFSNYSNSISKGCVFLGQHDGSPEKDVPDLSFTTDLSLTHRCFSADPGYSYVGVAAAGLGDIDGDGVRDWAIGYGAGEERVDVFPGVTTAPGPGEPAIAAEPFLRITGQQYATTPSASYVYRVGDFDGDSLADIGIGSRLTNVFYLVLGEPTLTQGGSPLWQPGDPPLELDLTNEATYGAFRVVRINLTGWTDPNSWFGMNAAAAGNLLPDEGDDEDPPQEVAIYQQNAPNQVVVVKGREVTVGPLDLEISASVNGTAANNDEVVRFQAEGGATEGLFGIDLSGGADLDGGGIPDLVIGHYRQAQQHPELPWSVYVIFGETIQSRLGRMLQGVGLSNPAPAPIGDGTLVGSRGVILQGAFRRPAILGDFDGAAGADLVMHDLSSTSWGSVWVRMNDVDDAQAIAQGTFPYADLTVTSPYAGQPAEAFGATAFPLDDFNGDGAPDILVGARDGGFPTIVY